MSPTNDENSFSEFYKLDWLKLAFLIYHLLFTFVSPALLYSVIWYEKNSSDLRSRTLINQLLSHLCFIVLLSSLIARPLSVSVVFLGPFSTEKCDVILFVGRYLFICCLGQLTLRQVIKYLYIFQWKHLVGLNEDFAAFFVTLTNFVLTGLVEFTAYFLGFHYSDFDFSICR
jgi:hypothetical protein